MHVRFSDGCKDGVGVHRLPSASEAFQLIGNSGKGGDDRDGKAQHRRHSALRGYNGVDQRW